MSHFTTARIASLLFNTPLLLLPETAIAIASNLAERFDVDPMEASQNAEVIQASRFRGKPAGAQNGGRDLYRVENGVAVIGVMGELVNRGAWIGASSGLTSYEGLDAQLRVAAADSSVRGILLDLNSPGGEASGAMETGALVRSIADKKPVVAFVNGQAASAAYAIAAGASTIVTTPSGLAGSIGVVMLHLDRSAALAKAGVKPTLIHAGAHKVDGNSLQALPDEARARIQTAIDSTYDLFVKSVAAHRGLAQTAVRKTEGGLFMGQKAVDAGLADKVGTFDDALALFDPKPHPVGAFSMSTTDPQAGMITQAAHETQQAAAVSTAVAAALAADRTRVQAILDAPAAAGRESLARSLAFETDMTAESALALLAKAPAPAAAAVPHPAAARNRLVVDNPDIRPEDPAAAKADAAWDSVVETLNKRA